MQDVVQELKVEGQTKGGAGMATASYGKQSGSLPLSRLSL